MASDQPIIKQIKILSLIPQFLTLVMVIILYYLIRTDNPILYGTITYLVVSIIIREAIPRNHRKGIRLYKKAQYQEAVYEFEESYYFFSKNIWIDKYRYIVLLSSSRISYREMALINMAYCYSQLGEGSKSKELYEKTLVEFPDSQLAKSALRIFNAAIKIEKI